MFSERALVLTLGLDDASKDWSLGLDFHMIPASTREVVLEHLNHRDVAVLVLGPSLNPQEAHRILSSCHIQFPHRAVMNIVLGVRDQADIFQDCIDEGRMFYLANGPISKHDLRSLVVAAVQHFESKREQKEGRLGNLAVVNATLDFCVSLTSQVDVTDVGNLLADAVHRLGSADRAHCLIYDLHEETLSCVDAVGREECVTSACSGLVGFVARTGKSVQLERIGVDCRYDSDADNPGGNGGARFIAEPILGTGNVVVGVQTAIREVNSAPFSAEDVRAIRVLVTCAAASIDRLLMLRRLQTLSSHVGDNGLYRREALEDHDIVARDEHGDVLTTLPSWLRRTHWVLLASLVAALGFLTLTYVNEYASGRAIVQARNKLGIPAIAPGTIASIDVEAGDRVRLGDVLLRFHNTQSSLSQFVQAPVNGILSDIRVHIGQRVDSGDHLATVIDEAAGFELLVMLPASYKPRLRPGLPMVLKLDSYPNSQQIIPIQRIASGILNATDAVTYTQALAGQGISNTGPVVLVHSSLDDLGFMNAGQHHLYEDGMVGEVQVRVNADRAIASVIPALKTFGR